MKDFNQLFREEIKEIYCAEQSSIELFQEIANSSGSDELKKSIKSHIHTTENQIKRLELIATELQFNLSSLKCQPMEGFHSEWQKLKSIGYSEEVLDSAVISFIQKIKHFEISSYGTLKCFARHLGMKKAVTLLRESIREEVLYDEWLTQLAEKDFSGINCKACQKKVA